MAKKLMALLMAGLLTLSAALLASCDKKEEEKKEDNTSVSDATGEADTSADSKTEDTSKAEENTTEDTTTEAKKRDSYTYISMYDENGTGHQPHSLLGDGLSVASHFKFDAGYLQEITIGCPSWSDNIGSLTAKLYKWDTDYATTIAASPLWEETFVDYDDNATLSCDFSDGDSYTIGAGEYLWWLGDGVDEGGSGVGLWVQAYPTDENIVELFANGEVIENEGWEGDITIIVPAE